MKSLGFFIFGLMVTLRLCVSTTPDVLVTCSLCEISGTQFIGKHGGSIRLKYTVNNNQFILLTIKLSRKSKTNIIYIQPTRYTTKDVFDSRISVQQVNFGTSPSYEVTIHALTEEDNGLLLKYEYKNKQLERSNGMNTLSVADERNGNDVLVTCSLCKISGTQFTGQLGEAIKLIYTVNNNEFTILTLDLSQKSSTNLIYIQPNRYSTKDVFDSRISVQQLTFGTSLSYEVTVRGLTKEDNGLLLKYEYKNKELERSNGINTLSVADERNGNDVLVTCSLCKISGTQFTGQLGGAIKLIYTVNNNKFTILTLELSQKSSTNFIYIQPNRYSTKDVFDSRISVQQVTFGNSLSYEVTIHALTKEDNGLLLKYEYKNKELERSNGINTLNVKDKGDGNGKSSSTERYASILHFVIFGLIIILTLD